MEIDPTEVVNFDDEEETTATSKEKSRNQLNSYVAITVAMLATFMGICQVKGDNIVQQMQQAQADKIDYWAWYQARNIREEIANATVVQLQLQANSQPPAARSTYQKQIAAFQQVARSQNQKKEELREKAENEQKKYDKLNVHDDQFDLSDAFASIAIALFALTSLLQKRWLFGVAMIPTAFGVFMGFAGLFAWDIHPQELTKLISQTPPKTEAELKLTSNYSSARSQF